jgi:hypothetical protein
MALGAKTLVNQWLYQSIVLAGLNLSEQIIFVYNNSLNDSKLWKILQNMCWKLSVSYSFQKGYKFVVNEINLIFQNILRKP